MAYKCSSITPILKWILERGMEGRVLTSSVPGYGQEEGWCEPDICLRGPSNASSFLTRWGNIKISGNTLLCGGCEAQWSHLNLRTSRVLLLASGDKIKHVHSNRRVGRLCNYINFRQFTFSFVSLVTSNRLTEFRNLVVSTRASYLRIPCFISRPQDPAPQFVNNVC
jgi:hypothetical protein